MVLVPRRDYAAALERAGAIPRAFPIHVGIVGERRQEASGRWSRRLWRGHVDACALAAAVRKHDHGAIGHELPTNPPNRRAGKNVRPAT